MPDLFYGRKVSYKELKEKVDSLVAALHDLGVKKGDRVAVHLLNSPQYIITFMAVSKLGAVVTPISPVYVAPEIRHQIEDSDTETIITHDMFYDLIEEACPNLKNVILVKIEDYLPSSKKFLGNSNIL